MFTAMLVLADVRIALGELDNVVLLLSLITPILTALITTPFAREWQKGLVSIVVTALTAALVKYLQDDSMTWSRFASAWLQLIVAHLVAWEFLVRRPAGLINENTPGIVGPKVPDAIMVDTSTAVVVDTTRSAPVIVDDLSTPGTSSPIVVDTTTPTKPGMPDDGVFRQPERPSAGLYPTTDKDH